MLNNFLFGILFTRLICCSGERLCTELQKSQIRR